MIAYTPQGQVRSSGMRLTWEPESDLPLGLTNACLRLKLWPFIKTVLNDATACRIINFEKEEEMNKVVVPLVMLVALILVIGTAGCGGDDGETPVPTAQPTSTSEPQKNVVITIGNLTDKTGPGATAMAYVDMGLADTVDYYNENSLIPGIKVKVIEYDGQFDPSRDIPGYEWLKEKGADVIMAFLQITPVTLQPKVNKDKVVLFTATTEQQVLYPPGYIFAMTNLWEELVYTQLKWIVENDWDYRTKGPAKLGGAGWNDPGTNITHIAAEAYAEAHPDQFEWVGGYLTEVATFNWGPEVEALKDCDYIFAPIIMSNFAKEYRTAGYTAKFLAGEAQTSFFGVISDARLWDEIDGSLFTLSTKWWNEEEGELLDLVKDLMHQNRPGDAEDIMRAGKSYFAVTQAVQMLEIIKTAAENVGPENVDSQAIYEAAQSFSMTVDGMSRFSFSETKRTAVDYLAIYEANGAAKDIFRASDWLPVVTEP